MLFIPRKYELSSSENVAGGPHFFSDVGYNAKPLHASRRICLDPSRRRRYRIFNQVAIMTEQQQPEQNKRVFPPPDKPVECSCLHCGRVYMSDMMIEVEIDGEYHYACPVKGCTAMGWNFDIF